MNELKELKELMRRYIVLRDEADGPGLSWAVQPEFERVEDELLRALDD